MYDLAIRGIISESEYKQRKVKFLYGAMVVLLVVGVIVSIYPLIWLILSSFKDKSEVFQIPLTLFPKKFKFESYIDAWNKLDFLIYIKNTGIIMLGNVLVSIFIPSLAGYSLAKLNPRGGKILFYLFLISLMTPLQVYMVPLFMNLRDLPIFHFNLLDTYWALWLPAGANAFALFLYKGFFEGLPTEIIEAANCEGASQWKIFTKIVIPLSIPVFVVMIIFTIRDTWNSFFWPYIVLGKTEMQPIMVALVRNFLSLSYQPVVITTVLASLVISCILPVILFAFFQKYIMQGVNLSGLK